MSTRELVSDDGRSRRYRVLDDQGRPIGYDDELIPTAAEANELAVRTRARAALTANAAFLALPSPTAAQTGAQVRRLTRQVQGLLRLLLADLDDVSDTNDS